MRYLSSDSLIARDFPKLADYAHLPTAAVAVIPPGETVVYAAAVTSITNTVSDSYIEVAISLATTVSTTVSYTLTIVTPVESGLVSGSARCICAWAVYPADAPPLLIILDT